MPEVGELRVPERLADAVEVTRDVDGPDEGKESAADRLALGRIRLVVGEEGQLGTDATGDGVGQRPRRRRSGCARRARAAQHGAAALHAPGIEFHDVESSEQSGGEHAQLGGEVVDPGPAGPAGVDDERSDPLRRVGGRMHRQRDLDRAQLGLRVVERHGHGAALQGTARRPMHRGDRRLDHRRGGRRRARRAVEVPALEVIAPPLRPAARPAAGAHAPRSAADTTTSTVARRGLATSSPTDQTHILTVARRVAVPGLTPGVGGSRRARVARGRGPDPLPDRTHRGAARRAVRARGHRRAQDLRPSAVVARGPRRGRRDPAGEIPVHGPRRIGGSSSTWPGGDGSGGRTSSRPTGPVPVAAPSPCAWGSSGARGSTSPRWGPRSASPCGSSATPRRSRGSPPSASTRSTRPSTPTPWPRSSAAASGNVKTVLAAQSIIAGIGNAYSDEILHVAHLSPFKPARNLDRDEVQHLRTAIVGVLADAVERAVGQEASELKGDKKRAMRVHGRTGEALPGVRRRRTRGVVRHQVAAVLRHVSDRGQTARRPAPVEAPALTMSPCTRL